MIHFLVLHGEFHQILVLIAEFFLPLGHFAVKLIYSFLQRVILGDDWLKS